MSSNTNTSTSSGIGLTTLLTVAFVVMRLWPHATAADPNGHIINWSWWWVLAPIWISWSIALVILGIVILAILISAYKD